MTSSLRSLGLAATLVLSASGAIPDRPFLQDRSVRFTLAPNLTNATLLRLEVDRDGVAYVLTDHGVARTFGNTLALDHSFRPLAGVVPRDITLGRGALYYLLEDRWLSNGESGRPLAHLPQGKFEHIAVADDGAVLVSGPDSLALYREGRWQDLAPATQRSAVSSWVAHGSNFYALREDTVQRLSGDHLVDFHHGSNGLVTLAFREDEMLLGSHRGFYGISLRDGTLRTPWQTRLPVPDIHCLLPVAEGIWAGTPHGAFFKREPGRTSVDSTAPRLPDGPGGVRYYASKRWLPDDKVIDLRADEDGGILVLTRTGLSKIELRALTLARKADYFDHKLRSRHIRFGLTGERRLIVPGDLSSSEIVDTDNDGGWSSYYLGSQAFRYATTGSGQARSNAWEVFAALERLRDIAGTNGFFARTFERKGFKYSDPERWRESPGADWEWKGHTSSDEFTSQTFAHAVMWELVARSAAERRRLADNYTRILDHILDHDLYLIDVDGKPTLWGRWNPDYVNHYPFSIHDRRLNSAEITAGLQLGWAMTGRARYREKADELFQRHGYLTNILSSMKLLHATPGYVHQGEDMGDEWNHSDDELAFMIYWPLHHFAFTRSLRAQYATAIRDHWDFERGEQYPIWNFIYSACGGGRACDAAEAVWTLRTFPLDTITWSARNSHRQDVTRLPTNFYRHDLVELLPAGERPFARINTQPFILDGGDDGRTELPGDEFLFGYWLGRYLKWIGPG